MAAYAASRAFALSLTEALWWELRGTGVRTLAFAPTLTRTEFFDRLGTSQYPTVFMSPDDVARALLRAHDRRDPGPSRTVRRRDAVLPALSRLLTRRASVVAAARFAGRDLLAPALHPPRPGTRPHREIALPHRGRTSGSAVSVLECDLTCLRCVGLHRLLVGRGGAWDGQG